MLGTSVAQEGSSPAWVGRSEGVTLLGLSPPEGPDNWQLDQWRWSVGLSWSVGRGLPGGKVCEVDVYDYSDFPLLSFSDTEKRALVCGNFGLLLGLLGSQRVLP